jgi:serine/threonine protein kinase
MNVSHLYSSDANPVTNVPDSLSETLNESPYITFWAIMTHIEGVTMKEFVTQRYNHKKGFSLFDALTFTEKLLCIVKNIHAKGVVHRDLKPDNIMVKYQSYNDDTNNAELFVIDFGLAYFETSENIEIDWSTYDHDQYEVITQIGDSIGNRWYRVPQLNRQDTSKMTAKQKNDLFYVIRRSPTIDASSICAILFWMLTQIVPKQNRDEITNRAPHERDSAKIKTKIVDAVSSMSRKYNKLLSRSSKEEKANPRHCFPIPL